MLSIDGGRVNVDFNHPLAGKILVYDLTAVSKIEDTAERVQALIFYFVGIDKDDVKVEITQNAAEVEFKRKQGVHTEVKEMVATNVLKYVPGIEKMKFVDIFEKGAA